jgi:hypothetical protein
MVLKQTGWLTLLVFTNSLKVIKIEWNISELWQIMCKKYKFIYWFYCVSCGKFYCVSCGEFYCVSCGKFYCVTCGKFYCVSCGKFYCVSCGKFYCVSCGKFYCVRCGKFYCVSCEKFYNFFFVLSDSWTATSDTVNSFLQFVFWRRLQIPLFFGIDIIWDMVLFYGVRTQKT